MDWGNILKKVSIVLLALTIIVLVVGLFAELSPLSKTQKEMADAWSIHRRMEGHSGDCEGCESFSEASEELNSEIAVVWYKTIKYALIAVFFFGVVLVIRDIIDMFSYGDCTGIALDKRFVVVLVLIIVFSALSTFVANGSAMEQLDELKKEEKEHAVELEIWGDEYHSVEKCDFCKNSKPVLESLENMQTVAWCTFITDVLLAGAGFLVLFGLSKFGKAGEDLLEATAKNEERKRGGKQAYEK